MGGVEHTTFGKGQVTYKNSKCQTLLYQKQNFMQENCCHHHQNFKNVKTNAKNLCEDPNLNPNPVQ